MIYLAVTADAFWQAHSGLDETGAPIGVQQKLMRHANISPTMNVYYGNSTLRAKKQANSKVVQMVMQKTGHESAA